MAPKVQVPMDFGVKYLGSPSHSNLKFRLQDGEEIPANSVIISYNSPVIDSLSTDLLQTSIDVDDFGKEVVQDFVTSCYSGELQNISKGTLREMNKMSNVFEVSWMADRCVEFFKTLVDELDTEHYGDQLYVFEEAMYMLLTIKKKNFMKLVIEKFSTEIAKCDRFFVSQYLSDFSSRSTKQLSVIIEMVQKQKHVLLGILIDNFERNPSNIDGNSKFLLKNVSFSACNNTHKSMYQKLVDCLSTIESPSKEDYMLMVELFRKTDVTLSALQLQDHHESEASKLPNLFLENESIKERKSFQELLEFLLNSPLVTNSHVFLDGVFSWLFEFRKDKKAPHETFQIESFTEQLRVGMLSRGWHPLSSVYLNMYRGNQAAFLSGLIESLKNNTTGLTDDSGYERLCSISEYSPSEFFLKDHDIIFDVKEQSSSNCCDRIGSCGFILRVTSLKDENNFLTNSKNDQGENLFNIQLIVNPELYPSDLHFHGELFSAASMHFVMNVNGKGDCPVTWYNKPNQDTTNNHLNWGVNWFWSKNAGISPREEDAYHWRYFFGKEARIRPVVYYRAVQNQPPSSE